MALYSRQGQLHCIIGGCSGGIQKGCLKVQSTKRYEYNWNGVEQSGHGFTHVQFHDLFPMIDPSRIVCKALESPYI